MDSKDRLASTPSADRVPRIIPMGNHRYGMACLTVFWALWLVDILLQKVKFESISTYVP